MLVASLFQAQGDLCVAEPLYREAVQASRAALGDQHPNTSLASLLQAQGTPRHDLQARYDPVALLSRLCAAHTVERTLVCECERVSFRRTGGGWTNKSSVSEPRRQAARAVRERQSVVRLFVWRGGYRTLSKK